MAFQIYCSVERFQILWVSSAPATHSPGLLLLAWIHLQMLHPRHFYELKQLVPMNSSWIQLWSAPFVSTGVIQSHSGQRLRKGARIWMGGDSQGVISTPDNELGRKCPSGFPGITCAVGMYYKSGQWHLQNLFSLQLRFQQALKIQDLPLISSLLMAGAPMKLQAQFGPRAKPSGSHNLESLGCANREEKNSWKRNFSFFWSQNGFARVLSDEGTVLSRGDMCIILTM